MSVIERSGKASRATPAQKILDAAIRVFTRYGYKKASMDDLAKGAGISRQGLYSHYANKEALFAAAIAHLVERILADASAALTQRGPIEERLVSAFEALHYDDAHLAEGARVHELVEAARHVGGNSVGRLERLFAELIAGALAQSGVAAAWKPLRIGPKQLAGHLFVAANGIRDASATRKAYRMQMAIAMKLVVHGRARSS